MAATASGRFGRRLDFDDRQPLSLARPRGLWGLRSTIHCR